MEPPLNFHEPRQRSSSRGEASQNESSQYNQPADAANSMQGQMAQMMFEAGSAQMKQVFSSYGRLDYLRPYFDVEPKTVRNRLFQSLMPRKPSLMQAPTDLYGPLMLIFTLVALLLFTMKSGNYQVTDGTLVGTAILTCFTYWFTTTIIISTVAYIFIVEIPFVNIAAIIGYGMFSHCIILGITALWHTNHDHLYFFILLLIFCGLSCLRMGLLFAAKTRHIQQKLIMFVILAIFHCSFIAYLHFGFETMVEELDEMLGHELISQHSRQILQEQKEVPIQISA